MNADESSRKKYWAFLSYSSKDKKIAKWLHRKIEGYPFSKGVRIGSSTSPPLVGKRMRPVFRDRDEFASHTDLEAGIQQALAQSECLIVICSPNASQSSWVNREIEAFRALGPHQRILALIVDGVPNASSCEGVDDAQECFPPALRAPHELVAADLRKEGDGKTMAFLKLLAGIALVDFDHLYRRDRRQRARMRLIFSATSSVLCIVFAALAGFAFVQKRNAEEKTRIALQRRDEILGVVDALNYDLRDVLTKYAPVEERDRIFVMADRLLATIPDQDANTASRRETAVHLLNRAKAIVEDLSSNPADARPLLSEALQIFESATKTSPENWLTKIDLAVCVEAIADLEKRIGNFDLSLSHSRRALELRTEVSERFPDRPRFALVRANSFSRIGDIEKKLGRLAEAEAMFRAAADCAAKVAKDKKESGKAAEVLSMCFDKLATIHSTRGAKDKALEVIGEALATSEELVKADPLDMTRSRLLAHCLSRRASIREKDGEIEAAAEDLNRSLKLMEPLILLDPANSKTQLVRLEAMEALTNIEITRGDYASASRIAEEGLQVIKIVASRDQANVELMEMHARWHNLAGNVTFVRSSFQESLAQFAEAVSIGEAIRKIDPKNSDGLRICSVAENNLAQLHQQTGNLDAAKTAYQNSVNLARTLQKQLPADLDCRNDLVRSLFALADFQEDNGLLDEAITVYEESLAIAKADSGQHSPDLSLRRFESIIQGRIGNIRFEKKEFGLAEKTLRTALDLGESLTRESPADVELIINLSITHLSCARLAGHQKSHDVAMEMFTKSVAARENLARRFPGEQRYADRLVGAISEFAKYLDENGKSEEAANQLLKAEGFLRELLEKHGDSVVRKHSLAGTLFKLGLLHNKSPDTEKARTCLVEAVEISSGLVKAFPSNRKFAGELGAALNVLGALHMKTEAYEAASDVYATAVSHEDALASTSEEAFAHSLNAMINRMNLSRCLDKLGRDEASNDAFSGAIDKARELAGSGSEEDKQKLLQYADAIAGLQLKSGHQDRGIEFLKVCQSTLAKLSEAKPEERSYRRDQAVCLIKIGNAYLQGNSGDKAREQFNSALQLFTHLQAMGPLDANEQKMVSYCEQRLKAK